MKTRIITLAFLALFTGSVAFATNGENDKPEEIRYVGNLNELPVYRLSLNNENTAVYRVSIKDEEGNILFSEKISGTNIVRNYQLENAPTADYSLTFEVNNITDNKNTVYNINKTKKIFDEVQISEAK
ncbi:MAG: hypothetical protein ACK5NK_13965 [Niabella sp.]